MKELMKPKHGGKLFLRELEFVLRKTDGTETVVFTAASKEIADTIANMLDNVDTGGFKRGIHIGYKNGLKEGLLIGGAVMAMALIGYSVIQICLWRKAREEEKEEDDAE